jgi:hypothetical protein
MLVHFSHLGTRTGSSSVLGGRPESPFSLLPMQCFEKQANWDIWYFIAHALIIRKEEKMIPFAMII